jgi:hypothetical protein
VLDLNQVGYVDENFFAAVFGRAILMEIEFIQFERQKGSFASALREKN